MQIQPIANTKSDVKFKSASTIDQVSAFLNMDDNQLRHMSYIGAHDKKQEKKDQRSLAKIFYAIPVVDTIASAILVEKRSNLPEATISALRKAPLSRRLNAAAGTGLFWGISLAAIELYSLGKKAIESDSPNMKKFNRENPVLSFITDIAAITFGITIGLTALHKIASNSLKNHPERYDRAVENLSETKFAINNTKFNKKTLPKIAEHMEKFAAKNSWLAKTGRFALANSVLILIGVSVLKMVGQSNKEQNRIEHNYKQLKQAQFNVSKQMVKVLSQENKLMLEELKETANDKKCAECCDEPKEIKKAPTKKHASSDKTETKKNDSVEQKKESTKEPIETVEETKPKEPKTTKTESVEE